MMSKNSPVTTYEKGGNSLNPFIKIFVFFIVLGLFVMPDYEEGTIQFYTREKGHKPTKKSTLYPPDSKEQIKKSQNNCINCLVNKVGCFTL